MTRKIALITGGSRGLGKSMALHLANRGVDSLITYRSSRTEAQQVVTAIQAQGGNATALFFDATDSQSFDAFSAQIQTALHTTWNRDRFDFLINNAGIGLRSSFLETPEAMFDELMAVHLKAPFFLTQKLAPLIEDGGRIINISSGLTRFTLPGYAAYSMMKGGVEVLSRYLAKELAPRGIRVNTFAPGAIATDFGGGVTRDNAQANAQVASVTALGRVGEADDIGGAIALLLAPENHWITGQRIEASGGMFL